jgi:hypothetical protein
LVTAAQFGLVAPIYLALERLVFGAHLDNARQAFLKYVLEANLILLVGEGNDRFLKSVMARKLVGCIKGRNVDQRQFCASPYSERPCADVVADKWSPSDTKFPCSR